MNIKSYITIAQDSEVELTIKKSRFITRLHRITSLEEATDFLAQVKKQDYRARHHCHAYRLLTSEQPFQHASDDGEPSGTAGIPILESLKAQEIQNVIAVTTRYFGGIKLGTGGLIRAYRQGITEAIHAVGRVQIAAQQLIEITLDYKQLEPLKYWLQTNHYQTLKIDYTAEVQLHLAIPQSQITEFQVKLQEQFANKLQLQLGAITPCEIPLSN
ncbi:YigZ family protein [Lactobacillus sp. DCY120]|uniref:YigZ family protein n=1 Tax=Bombilactobacillus apium TaxID=2675299 RepID=A0A850R1M4_9LACO|nr:YigZ family protein [Bombilactobacillus apium]NVY96823.1 YigZ family protein [Bombilactobacillus apium]